MLQIMETIYFWQPCLKKRFATRVAKLNLMLQLTAILIFCSLASTVQACSGPNAMACTDTQLCMYGTKVEYGIRKWNGQKYSAGYKKEALKRKLNCGVGEDLDFFSKFERLSITPYDGRSQGEKYTGAWIGVIGPTNGLYRYNLSFEISGSYPNKPVSSIGISDKRTVQNIPDSLAEKQDRLTGNRFFINPTDLRNGKFKRFFNGLTDEDRSVVKKVCGTLSNEVFVDKVVFELKSHRKFDQKFREYWADKKRISEISSFANDCMASLGLDATKIAPQFLLIGDHDIKPINTVFAGCSQDSADLKSVQSALKKLGFYKSRIDGAYGPGTQRALLQAHYKLGDWADDSICVSTKELRLLMALNAARALRGGNCSFHTKREAELEWRRLKDAGLTSTETVQSFLGYESFFSTVRRLEKKLISSGFYTQGLWGQPNCKLSSAEIQNLKKISGKPDPAPAIVTQVIGDLCYKDPEKCSPTELCKRATQNASVGAFWNTEKKSAAHVAFAKATGASCGVAANSLTDVKTPVCADKPEACSRSELCLIATTKLNADRVWNADAKFSAHVLLAKSKGLACDVKQIPLVAVNRPTCLDDPSKCSVVELCKNATGTDASGETFWRMDASLQPYVDIAVSAGVTCGVKKVKTVVKAATCGGNPANCSIAELCQRAISFETGALNWSTTVNGLPYAQFAKRSGVTCGIRADDTTADTDQRPTEPATSKKILKYKNRKALVIGNANYSEQTPLKNPINDAKAVAAKLQQIGFEVTYKEDLEFREFGRALGRFERTLSSSDISLIYYAGHGIEVDGENYLIPVDAELRNASDVKFETVMLQDAVSASLNTGKLSMVLIDACRDNPFAKSMKGKNRSIGRGLSVVDARRSKVDQIISFAAESGEFAEDGNGDNSPYAAALIDLLDEPNLEVGKLFRKLGDSVDSMTKGKQIPVTRNRLSGEDIFFVVE
jgi:hypothetical protein